MRMKIRLNLSSDEATFMRAFFDVFSKANPTVTLEHFCEMAVLSTAQDYVNALKEAHAKEAYTKQKVKQSADTTKEIKDANSENKEVGPESSDTPESV